MKAACKQCVFDRLESNDMEAKRWLWDPAYPPWNTKDGTLRIIPRDHPRLGMSPPYSLTEMNRYYHWELTRSSKGKKQQKRFEVKWNLKKYPNPKERNLFTELQAKLKMPEHRLHAIQRIASSLVRLKSDQVEGFDTRKAIQNLSHREKCDQYEVLNIKWAPDTGTIKRVDFHDRGGGKITQKTWVATTTMDLELTRFARNYMSQNAYRSELLYMMLPKMTGQDITSRFQMGLV